MSIPRAKQAWALSTILLAGCGANPGTHYDGTKDYGQTDSGSGDAVQAADPVITLPSAAPAPAASPKAAPSSPVAAPGPSAPAPSPGAPTVDPDPAPAAPPKLPPDTLIKNEHYGSVFDTASARGIKDSSGYKALGALAGSKVRANLTSKPTDGLTIAQTFGDGVAHSTVTQDLVNSAADANRIDGMPTTSGRRTLSRVTSADCPGVFLCIDKMIVAPTVGDPRTVCFADAATGKAKPYPYGALPNYKAADFTPNLGTYGPYTVTAYAGNTVDCAAPGTATVLATETAQVIVTSVDVSKLSLSLEVTQPEAPQFAISLANARVKDDLVSPYLDETVALDGNKTFVLNADKADMTALIVTSRESVSIAQQTGGGIIGGLAGVLVGIDGVVVDLHFELCQNLLDKTSVDHCAAAAAPAN